MKQEDIEAVMNSTFSGLALFCRDLELTAPLIEKYQLNQIIMERGFTDLTHRIGGQATNFRYLVASSNAKDISALSQNPEFGHIMLQSGAYFKVLDIQKEGDKTQVLLLHIPEEGVDIFRQAKVNIEDQVVEKGVEIFKEHLLKEPIKDLQSNDWIERTSFPLGMNSDGVFFLDMKDESTSDNESVEKETSEDKVDRLTELAEKMKKQEAAKPEKKSFWSRLFGK